MNTGLRGANLFRRPPQGPGLGEALEFVRSGDTFVVTKLDGLARSVPHMREIVQRLQAKSVALRIVTTLDTSPLVMRRTLASRLEQFSRLQLGKGLSTTIAYSRCHRSHPFRSGGVRRTARRRSLLSERIFRAPDNG